MTRLSVLLVWANWCRWRPTLTGEDHSIDPSFLQLVPMTVFLTGVDRCSRPRNSRCLLLCTRWTHTSHSCSIHSGDVRNWTSTQPPHYWNSFPSILWPNSLVKRAGPLFPNSSVQKTHRTAPCPRNHLHWHASFLWKHPLLWVPVVVYQCPRRHV